MTNWQRYWATAPTRFGPTEYLKQVGHTVNGEAYPEDRLQLLISGIQTQLELNENDRLLDLCCGNGVLTVELGKCCAEILGVDFSEPLLDIARRDHQLKNIDYRHINVRDLDRLLLTHAETFTKVLMYGSLQHFEDEDLQTLLDVLLGLCTDHRVIFLGGVPNRTRKRNFHDSARKRLLAIYYRMTGRDRIGHWWYPRTIENACRARGLTCQIDDSSADRPGADWRFDAKIS